MKSNLVLDDTLRYLYITLRRRGARLLAIRFIHRGKKWEADTPEEAVRLRQNLDNLDIHEMNSDPDREDQIIRSESVWTPDAFWDFVQSAGPQQQRIVRLMLEKRGVRSEEMAEHLSISEVSLAGVLSGLSKQLRHLELKPSDLYLVHTDWNGKNKSRTFFLEKGFRLAADELGWPDAVEERSKMHAASTKAKRKH